MNEMIVIILLVLFFITLGFGWGWIMRSIQEKDKKGGEEK